MPTTPPRPGTRPSPDAHDIGSFLPYLLTRAAEATSLDFAHEYKARHGLLRTEWRVLFHLGQRGPITASEIVASAGLHKTKVSRAVAKLEAGGFLVRSADPDDRRRAVIGLSRAGRALYDDLAGRAAAFDAKLAERLSGDEWTVLVGCLRKLTGPCPPAPERSSGGS